MIAIETDHGFESRNERRYLRAVQSVEVLVFLFLIVPSLVLPLFAVREGEVNFVITAVATIFRDVALVALILFFLWRNGEPVTAIGWKGRGALRELVWGIVLYVPFFFAAILLDKILQDLGLTGPNKSMASSLKPEGVAQTILALALVIVVAWAEETIFRGYLMLRFRPLTGTVGAVVCSSIIFAVGHGYEGTAGLVTVGTMGATFAVIYLWRGSLIAPMVMHFLQDFLSIVLLPLLGQS